MRTAHLNFEAIDGAVSVVEVYEGGFDLENPAHCFARALMKLAPTIGAEPSSEAEVTPYAPPVEVDAHQIMTPGAGPIYLPS